MLKLLLKISQNDDDRISSRLGENNFNRIILIHSVGAFVLAPLLSLVLYLSEAPIEFVHYSLSYSIGFVFYGLICVLIPSLKDQLVYFVFFHLFLLTFFIIYYLSIRGFKYEDVVYALPFYILSLIIIQRLYPALLYNVFVVTLLIYANQNIEKTEVNLTYMIPFFIFFGAAVSVVIYVRGKILERLEEYAIYLKKIVNIPGTGFVLFDIKNDELNVIDSNDEAKKFLQTDSDIKSLSNSLYMHFTPEEFKKLKELKFGNKFTKEIMIQLFNSRCDIELNIGILTHKKRSYWLTTLKDITQENKKRTALESNEKKYRNLYFKNKAGVFTLNREGEILNGNESFFKMFDKTVKEGDFIFAQDEVKDWQLILDSLNETGSIYNYQTQLVLSNKVIKTFLFSWYVDDFSGHIEGSVIDLTNIQRASQAIKHSEEKYRLIFEESNDAILLLNGDKIIESNRKATAVFGKNREELKRVNFFDLSWKLGEEEEKNLKEYKRILAQKKNVKFNWEFKGNKSDSIVQAEVALIEINLEGKLYYQCVIHDQTEVNKLEKEKMRAEIAEETNLKLENEIRERIKAQKTAQEQFLRTKAILDSSSNTFLLTLSSRQLVTSFNYHCEAYFLQIFNKRLQQGTRFRDYFEGILSKPRLRLFNILFKQVEQGKSHQIEVRFEGVNNNEFWMEIFMNPIFDTEGNVSEISLVSHDISEKKKSNIAIVESLKEKEILLKEIHHRVKNNLQVISSILNLQSSFVTDTQTLNILQESRNRIRSMAIIHENLYQTKDFSSINFGNYLHNLTQNLITSYRVSGDISLVADINKVDLVLDQAIPCGLLVNEIITNSLKYAWETGKGGIITLKLHQEGTTVSLELSDDGKGLPDEFENIQEETLGLQLVLTLSEQLDGVLKVDRKNGTKYLLKFENIKTLTDVKN